MITDVDIVKNPVPVRIFDESVSYEEAMKITMFNSRIYLILLEGTTKDNESKPIKTYLWVEGRQTAYDEIKDILISSLDMTDFENPYYADWDLFKSKIIADAPKVKISDAKSIYWFMRHCKDKNLVEDDDTSFDIDDWKYQDDPDDIALREMEE